MTCTTHFGLQSQTIRLFEPPLSWRTPWPRRECHPLCCPFPENFGHHACQKTTLSMTIRTPIRMPDFKFELFPFHSPLLWESLLVSFPPLTDMLKFSGYPYLIWDPLILVHLYTTSHMTCDVNRKDVKPYPVTDCLHLVGLGQSTPIIQYGTDKRSSGCYPNSLSGSRRRPSTIDDHHL
jgi:hypothetical protein